MKNAVIVRYCEIHLKGKNRGYFERLLKENVERNLAGIPHSFRAVNARYLIENFNEDDLPLILEKLGKICGIHSFSPALVVENDFEKITECALFLTEGLKGSFKAVINRADKTFPLNSMEIARELGGRILDERNDLFVDVISPEHTVNVDIRESGETFVYTAVIKGLGGLPTGSGGKGLLMLSGGIDSPVAGYMMAKRGMKIDAIHFHSYPYTSEAALDKVKELAEMVSEYTNGIRLFTVKFTHIQEAIHEKCPEEFMITLMRRFMMRIAERIAEENGSQAIITGESLGQVASQTIESITSSNSVVHIPVLRPLIAFDKLDIIAIANKIKTYETSILPYEDCCTVFLPKHPAIKPRLDAVVAAEKALDTDALIDEALKTVEISVY